MHRIYDMYIIVYMYIRIYNIYVYKNIQYIYIYNIYIYIYIYIIYVYISESNRMKIKDRVLRFTQNRFR